MQFNFFRYWCTVWFLKWIHTANIGFQVDGEAEQRLFNVDHVTVTAEPKRNQSHGSIWCTALHTLRWLGCRYTREFIGIRDLEIWTLGKRFLTKSPLLCQKTASIQEGQCKRMAKTKNRNHVQERQTLKAGKKRVLPTLPRTIQWKKKVSAAVVNSQILRQ